MIAEALNDLLVRGNLGGHVLDSLRLQVQDFLLLLVVGKALHATLGVQLLDDLLVLPSDLVGQTSDCKKPR